MYQSINKFDHRMLSLKTKKICMKFCYTVNNKFFRLINFATARLQLIKTPITISYSFIYALSIKIKLSKFGATNVIKRLRLHASFSCKMI